MYCIEFTESEHIATNVHLYILKIEVIYSSHAN